MRRLIVLVFVLICASSAIAGQTTIPNYETARENFYWNWLYVNGGDTVYCNHVFLAQIARPAGTTTPDSVGGERLSIEHAYSAQWIAVANGCDNRNVCEVEAYKFAEADLHNLWPAVRSIKSSRGDQPYGEIPGENSRRFEFICPDYERTSGDAAIVEPQDQSKGELARSIMYMMISYDLPERVPVALLVRWHFADPPGDDERWRNNAIEALQGTRNPLIDYPDVLRLVPQ